MNVSGTGIAVLGSMNMDLVATVGRAPRPGETVTGERFFTVPGGKGANQAIAARLSGAPVTMLGSVGRDHYGDEIVALLGEKGLRTDQIDRVDRPTGTAHIVVEGNGTNSIIIIPGANGATVRLTDRHRAAITAAQFLLLQLELPVSLVTEAAVFAHQHGVRVVLTPAPVQPLPDELMSAVDLVVLNEGEALDLTGRPDVGLALGALAASVPAVIVTRGERGCVYRGPAGEFHQPAYAVEAIDTTAAGDTFVGALCARLAAGADVPAALRWASAAAALAVQQWGASSSMPTSDAVERFLVDRT